MKPFLETFFVLAIAAVVSAESIRLTDGTRVEVVSVRVRGDVVVLVMPDGELRSVPRSYVDAESLPDAAAMIAEAIELVGLRGLTDQIATSAQRAVSDLRDGSGRSMLVGRAMLAGFDSERLYAIAEQTFRERASERPVEPVLEWLRSPLGRRTQRAQSNASQESRASFRDELAAEPPTRERVELLLRLDRASGTSEAAVEMQTAMTKALLRGLYPSKDEGGHAIEEALERARPRLERKTRSRIQMSLHFMYRDLSDEALRKYVEFLESEDGAWLSDVLLEALFAAMEEGARRAGEVLAEALKLRV